MPGGTQISSTCCTTSCAGTGGCAAAYVCLAPAAAGQLSTALTAVAAAYSEPPEELCCPITLALLEDPVVLSDGHVYSRAAIEDWLRRGKGTSPVTGRELASHVLTPCHLVHGQVVKWCEASGARAPARRAPVASPGSP